MGKLNKKTKPHTGRLKFRDLLRAVALTGFMVIQLQAQDIIRNLEISGVPDKDRENLISLSGMRAGLAFAPVQIRSANQRIVDDLINRGYLFARIDSVSVLKPDSGYADLTWHVNPGQLVRIGEVKIQADSINAELVRTRIDLPTGNVYNQTLVEAELANLNILYAGNGYPLAEVLLKNTRIRSAEDGYEIDLEIVVKPGEKIRLDQFHLRGNTVTLDEVILRELEVKTGDIYDQEKIDRIPEILHRLGYFKEIAQPRLTFTQDNKRVLLIQVTEGNTTTFDGVIGYIPPAQNVGGEDGYFTGLIDLSFRNLFGTGRKFEVHWKKQDRYSDEFHLYYEEPWIFGFPLNLGGGLYRLVRDTTYIERSYTLNGTLRITSNFNTTFSLMQKSYVPDSTASRDMRLAENEILSGELGIIYDTRDFPVNPRRGLMYETYFSYGLKRNVGPEYLFTEDGLVKNEEIRKLSIGLSLFQRLWQNQIVALRFYGSMVRGAEDQLQLTDHIWFGGARSLRGYREDQFHGTIASWANLEYRFLTGRESRIYLFNDWGYYQYKQDGKIDQDILPGYGIGIRFLTPLGIMSVDFGLGRNDSVSNGKIHVGIVNRF